MRRFSSICLISICIALFFVFFGCAEREREKESEESQKAADALMQAEEAIKKAGIGISFKEAANLNKDNITQILPDPLAIGALQRDKPDLLKDAISSFYKVLEALPGQAVPAPAAPALAPAAKPQGVSKTDLALIHLHLGYLYVISAVGELTLSGMGPDGQPNTQDDAFFIEIPKELATKGYRFKLSEATQARFEALDKLPNPKPEDYLKLLTEDQRQAILDSLVILLGVKVKILPAPAAGIKEQTAKVDPKLYRRDMLFHLEKAIIQAKEIAPTLGEAFDEFNRVVAEVFSKDLLDKTEKWGFKIENKAEVEDRLKNLFK